MNNQKTLVSDIIGELVNPTGAMVNTPAWWPASHHPRHKAHVCRKGTCAHASHGGVPEQSTTVHWAAGRQPQHGQRVARMLETPAEAANAWRTPRAKRPRQPPLPKLRGRTGNTN